MLEKASTSDAIVGNTEKMRIMITAGAMKNWRDWRSSHSFSLALVVTEALRPAGAIRPS